MTNFYTRDILQRVKDGKISVDEAESLLKVKPFEDLGFAHVDYHRGVRQGENEVIYGQGKTPEQIVGIAKNMVEHGLENILITRLSKDAYAKICPQINCEYFESARIAVVNKAERAHVGNVVVVSAGTSDIAVCEEAAITALTLGSKVERIYDVGVSGLHRLLAHVDELQKANVIVCVAGMEGALASVVGGLVDCPVIAVPTSVGYGANFGGLSALLSMMNSCSSGVSVVNIDNGFGAGYIANMINKAVAKR